MDNCCNTFSSMVAGVGDRFYDGRVHSPRAGDCHYRCDSRLHSEATRVVRHSSLVPLSLREREVHNCDHTDRSGNLGVRLLRASPTRPERKSSILAPSR